MSGYRYLPLVYDRWQQSYGKDFSSLVFPRLLATLRTHRVQPDTMLDLACGTGSLALMMARKGWRVWGVDASEGMIMKASRRGMSSKLPVEFLHQDMRSFLLPQQVSLVTCFFDSLNHVIKFTELGYVFRNVWNALTPGGLFVFDVNTEYCYRTLWQKSDTIDLGAYTLVLRNSYNENLKRASSRVTIFHNKGPLSEEYEETVHERYYSDERIRSLLKPLGFTVLECSDFNFLRVSRLARMKQWWVVRRNED
jgi:SAM-dependent methyltransferase